MAQFKLFFAHSFSKHIQAPQRQAMAAAALILSRKNITGLPKLNIAQAQPKFYKDGSLYVILQTTANTRTLLKTVVLFHTPPLRDH